MPVMTIEVPALGNRSHLVHDGHVAVAIDPPRDARHRSSGPPRTPASTSWRWPTPTCTTTTCRAGSALARDGTAPTTCSQPTSRSPSSGSGVRGGDVLTYGELELEVLATPGHTRHHQSFLVRCPASRPPCSPAAACCSAPWAAPIWSTRDWPCTWPAPSGTAPAPSADSTPTLCCCPPTASAASAPARRCRRRRTPATATIGDQPAPPGAERRPGQLLRGARGRLRPDPGVLPAHGPDQQGRRRARRGRPARSPSREVAAALAAGRWVVDLRDRGRACGGPPAGARSASSTPTSSRRTSAGWSLGRRADPARRPPRRVRARRSATWPASASRAWACTCSTAGLAPGRALPPGRLGGVPRRQRQTAERPVVVDVRQRRRVGRGPPARRRAPAGPGRRAWSRPRCRPASSGCTASPATAPASPPASCTGSAATSSTSTTLGAGRRAGHPDHPAAA